MNIESDFKDDVYEELKNAEDFLSLDEISTRFDRDREEVRLTLRSLVRSGIVAQNSDFDYRVTYPTVEVTPQT